MNTAMSLKKGKNNLKKLLKIKSQQTIDRVEIVEAEIDFYRKSIKKLRAYGDGRIVIRKKNFHPTCENKKILQFTLQNIATQMILMERELAVLINYGA